MAFLDRLAQAESDGLTASEQRVLGVLLQAPEDSVYMTAADVGSRAGVHESTVIRLAQKMRYAGFTDLRSELREHVGDLHLSLRAQSREAKTYELASLVEDEVAALQRMSAVIPQVELDEAAALLASSETVYLYGTSLLVDAMAKRLNRLGIRVSKVVGQGRDIAEELTAIGERDTFFAFVLSTTPMSFEPLYTYAATRGASTVVVADHPGLQCMPRPNFLFTALRGADDDYRTLIVPFVLGYAFELAIYHLDHKRFGQALERFDRLVELVDAADGTRVGRNGTPRGRRPTKITRG